jgi:hypothetical protein
MYQYTVIIIFTKYMYDWLGLGIVEKISIWYVLRYRERYAIHIDDATCWELKWQNKTKMKAVLPYFFCMYI